MKKNINLKVLLCLAVTLCTMLVMVAACTESEKNQTEQPSADAYEDPTEKATLTPITLAPFTLPPATTECPTPPAETTHDVEVLRAFFDTPSKVEGKTNGQLLFKDYDSDNPYTWRVHNEIEHIKYLEYRHSNEEYGYDEYDEFILWKSDGINYREYSGDVMEILSYFFRYENKMLNFGGTLLLDGFEYLKSIELCNITADELIVTNCNKLGSITVSGINSEENNGYFEKIYINARLDDCFGSPCAKEFRLVVSNPEIHRDFDITAIADGDGLVNIQISPDDELRNVYVEAAARSGSHFVGWYDEQGRLVSEKECFRLTEGNKLVYSEDGQLIRIEDKFYHFDDIATYTAKFEKD